MTYDFERKLKHKREKDPQTLETIAKDMGLTRERVRQIEMKALMKLRKAMRLRGYNLDDFTQD